MSCCCCSSPCWSVTAPIKRPSSCSNATCCRCIRSACVQQPVFEKERVQSILKRSGGNILTLDLRQLRAQLLRAAGNRGRRDQPGLARHRGNRFHAAPAAFLLQAMTAISNCWTPAAGCSANSRPCRPGLIPIRGSGDSVPGQIAAARGGIAAHARSDRLCRLP